MRVTIIPTDGFVSINDANFSNLNLSFIDSNIHAVQWYETHGEIEYKDPVTNHMTENREITSIDAFQPAIDAWQIAKDVYDAAVAAAAAKAAVATPVGGAPNVIA